MTQQDKIYRTLVCGHLVQQSGLLVGGSSLQWHGPDMQCAVDGQGRLTIPGSGIAGALVETVARLFPKLFTTRHNEWLRWTLTGKGKQPPGRGELTLRQSCVRFWSAHPVKAPAQLRQLRQGVGVRQATGGTASQRKALYDLEVVPPGVRWWFMLEIDTARGGPELEQMVLLALREWTQGRCWLGAGAARGLGWMRLEEFCAFRLPLRPQVVQQWPDNTLKIDSLRSAMARFGKLARPMGQPQLDSLTLSPELESLYDPFHYLILDVKFCTGPEPESYGWNTLSAGGHLAGQVAALQQGLLGPEGIDQEEFLRYYEPDFVPATTYVLRSQSYQEEPFLPGSGIRGPLRHVASAWHRGQGTPVQDPNAPDFQPGQEGKDRRNLDSIAQVFGLGTQSGRLLIRDALLLNSDDRGNPWHIAWFHHHAEDEFAGGVWGHGKFDRVALLEGQLGTQLVLEACSQEELQQMFATLRPALRLAELGYCALGGGKWRGHGWIRWQLTRAALTQAGRLRPLFESLDVCSISDVDRFFHTSRK